MQLILCLRILWQENVINICISLFYYIKIHVVTRYRFTSIRMTSVRKVREEQVLAGMRRNWRPDAWLLGTQNGAAAWIGTQGYHVIQQFHSRCVPRRIENRDWNRSLYTSVHSGHKVETTQVSTRRWMDKQNVVDSYLAIKRAAILI